MNNYKGVVLPTKNQKENNRQFMILKNPKKKKYQSYTYIFNYN